MAKSIPSLHIVADNIPEAHYLTTRNVLEKGMEIRTEYDLKDADGNFIHPPSRDASVLVSVRNPFNQPRFPVVSGSEIGVYMAEVLGLKDNMVVSVDRLKEQLKNGGGLTAKEWPYTYHDRLFSFPEADGSFQDQMELLLERLVDSPLTRRGVATTRYPEIDSLLKDDLPCLGEVQMRCTNDEEDLYLHMNTRWRSRDLFKAWHDNVLALTFLQQAFAKEMGDRLGREVKVGSYSDYSYSLHVYGQDLSGEGGIGDPKEYVKFSMNEVMERAMSSEVAKDLLILPQLKDYLSEEKRLEWNLGQSEVGLIEWMISELESGKLLA